MQQPIVGFHQDDQGHWVAELACGHGQHVRHDPPWQERAWVMTEEGRRSRLGMVLQCVRCDDPDEPQVAEERLRMQLSSSALAAYEDARVQGLCHEGAMEIAQRLDAEGKSSEEQRR